MRIPHYKKRGKKLLTYRSEIYFVARMPTLLSTAMGEKENLEQKKRKKIDSENWKTWSYSTCEERWKKKEYTG